MAEEKDILQEEDRTSDNTPETDAGEAVTGEETAGAAEEEKENTEEETAQETSKESRKEKKKREKADKKQDALKEKIEELEDRV